MILDYLYLLFEECERELRELGGSDEEKYYALANAMINLYSEKEVYRTKINAYEVISDEVSGNVLVLDSEIGALPYAILRRGRVKKLKARSLRKHQEEMFNKVFSRMGLPPPFSEIKRGEKYDFIVFSEYLSKSRRVEGDLDKFFRFLDEGGKIVVLDLESSGVFDDAEEWALRNGMRSKTIFKEKFKTPSRGLDYFVAMEYYFIEAKGSRYVKTGIFLIKP